MGTFAIDRPEAGDVVTLILEDHARFEALLRTCRRDDVDREAARSALAELLTAHAEAEEDAVYPRLRREHAIGEHEEEHGEEEHAEILEALVKFLKAETADSGAYESALEELATVVNHHSAEEETTILNPAREEVSEAVRVELGAAWAARRNELLDEGCASLDQVEALLAEAKKNGVIDAS